MSMFDLSGKVALVTGSTRGIGLAIAECLAAQGASIVVTGRSDAAAAQATADALNAQFSVETLALTGNVADPAAVGAMAQQVFKRFKRLDVLVNNAGVLRDGLIGMIRQDDIDNTLGTNLAGVINAIQSFTRLIERSGGGSIVNITSIIGVRGNVGQLVYGASKAGVIGATLSAAKELASKKIRVNAVAPGYIDTDMIRAIPAETHEERMKSIAMGRIGTPEDIARTVLYLASDLSTYVTGQVIGVDGGMLI
jgi:3-oxoacyl-[acyl-carrier protein] reductase